MEVFKFGDKKIGLYENGVFRKNVDITKHFMRKNKSWGIDLETFEKLPEDTKIELYETVNRKTYTTDWKTYAQNGTVENFGHGRQIFLNQDKFTKCEK